MRTAIGVIVGIIIGWSALAIWRGPTRWVFTRFLPVDPPDHVDRVRVWHDHVEQPGASWPA
jgi:hypothetical protein